MAKLLKAEKTTQHIYWKNIPSQAKVRLISGVFYYQDRLVYFYGHEKAAAQQWLTGKMERDSLTVQPKRINIEG